MLRRAVSETVILAVLTMVTTIATALIAALTRRDVKDIKGTGESVHRIVNGETSELRRQVSELETENALLRMSPPEK